MRHFLPDNLKELNEISSQHIINILEYFFQMKEHTRPLKMLTLPFLQLHSIKGGKQEVCKGKKKKLGLLDKLRLVRHVFSSIIS